MLTNLHEPPDPAFACREACSRFAWRLTPDQRVEFTHDHRWFCCGNISDPNGIFCRIWNKAFESTPLTWKVVESYEEGIAGLPSVVARQDQVKDDNLRAELRILSLVGHAVRRRLDAQRWRMLSPNAVLHPFFGPGVTVATDGTQIILFSFARFGTEYTIAARTNVIGPVTSTAVDIRDWDYSGGKSRITKKKEDRDIRQKSAAIALLEQLHGAFAQKPHA